MECSRSQCSNPQDPSQACPQCQITVYCSRQCRLNDWNAVHQPLCGRIQMSQYEEEKDPMLRVLGKGAYGEVVLVRHKISKDLFALKIVSIIQMEKTSLERHIPMKAVLREINIHSTLDHPNIIRLIKYWQDEVKLYLLLEFAPRGSLFHEVRRRKGLSEEKAWDVFTQTALGIKYLHDQHIAHRDLKPENLLLDENGNIKIADFGWCVQGDEMRSTFCGTLDYMAPEMLQQIPYSFSVDIWALGVLLYELTHGYAPFRAAKETEKCNQILHSTISFKSELSIVAQDLISNILKKDPEQRLTLDEILMHPWVHKFSRAGQIVGGSNVQHNDLGKGKVQTVSGLMASVEFESDQQLRNILLTQLEKLPDEGTGLMLPARGSANIIAKESKILSDLENWCNVPVKTGRKRRKIEVEAPLIRSNSLERPRRRMNRADTMVSKEVDYYKLEQSFAEAPILAESPTQSSLLTEEEFYTIEEAQNALEREIVDSQARTTRHFAPAVNNYQLQDQPILKARPRPSKIVRPVLPESNERMTNSRKADLERLTQELTGQVQGFAGRKQEEINQQQTVPKRPPRPIKEEGSFWDFLSCLSRSQLQI